MKTINIISKDWMVSRRDEQTWEKWMHKTNRTFPCDWKYIDVFAWKMANGEPLDETAKIYISQLEEEIRNS